MNRSDSLDERIHKATLLDSSNSTTSPQAFISASNSLRIKPNFNAIKYLNESRLADDSNSSFEGIPNRNILIENLQSELEAKHTILSKIFSKLSEISQTPLTEENVFEFLDEKLKDVTNITRFDCTKADLETRQTILELEMSELEQIKCEKEIISMRLHSISTIEEEREKRRNVERENENLKLENLQRENENLKRKMTKMKLEFEKIKNPISIDQQSQTSPDTGNGKIFATKDRIISELKSELENEKDEMRRTSETVLEQRNELECAKNENRELKELVVECEHTLEKLRSEKARFKSRAESAENAMREFASSREFILMKGFSNYLTKS